MDMNTSQVNAMDNSEQKFPVNFISHVSSTHLLFGQGFLTVPLALISLIVSFFSPFFNQTTIMMMLTTQVSGSLEKCAFREAGHTPHALFHSGQRRADGRLHSRSRFSAASPCTNFHFLLQREFYNSLKKHKLGGFSNLIVSFQVFDIFYGTSNWVLLFQLFLLALQEQTGPAVGAGLTRIVLIAPWFCGAFTSALSWLCFAAEATLGAYADYIGMTLLMVKYLVLSGLIAVLLCLFALMVQKVSF